MPKVFFHNEPGKALTPQNKIDQSNLPFTLNSTIGCLFKCIYCYTQGFPFSLHTKFGEEVKVKTWLPEILDQELSKYQDLPQNLKRVQVNPSTEGYLPLAMIKTRQELDRDILGEALEIFRNHWDQGNKWMVHVVTKSHMILEHLDLLSSMREQVQVELTITTLDEERKKILEGYAPTVKKRLQAIERLAGNGIFVRVMCMPFIGTIEEASQLKQVALDHGAQGFKHKSMNYWDEEQILAGNLVRVKGRKDTIYHELTLNSGEPVVENGEPLHLTAPMPIIIKPGKSKRWQGITANDFELRDMQVEQSGYSELNDIDWGYVR